MFLDCNGAKMLIIFCVVIFSLMNCCCGQPTENAISAEAEPLLNISKNTRSRRCLLCIGDYSRQASNFDLVPSIHRDFVFQIHDVLAYVYCGEICIKICAIFTCI